MTSPTLTTNQARLLLEEAGHVKKDSYISFRYIRERYPSAFVLVSSGGGRGHQATYRKAEIVRLIEHLNALEYMKAGQPPVALTK